MLSNTLTKLLVLPYSYNYLGAHEKLIEDLLTSSGFNKTEHVLSKKEFWKHHLEPNWKDAIENNSFIIQPFGSQSTPDFIIKYKDILIPLEAKSSQTAKPTYNGGLPKQECIYAFTCKKHDSHTLFFGKDIISKEKNDRLIAHHKRHRLLDEEFEAQEITNDTQYKRGFKYYTRAMYIQTSSHLDISNDYFTHPQRETCENNVLHWVKQLEL
jgi:hypothetical protein